MTLLSDPVSTVLEITHKASTEATCDYCGKSPAPHRTFPPMEDGGELIKLCASCKSEVTESFNRHEETLGTCEWCEKKMKHMFLSYIRLFDEGKHGDFHLICGSCNEIYEKEIERIFGDVWS